MAKKNTAAELEFQKYLKKFDPVFKLCNSLSKEYTAKSKALAKEMAALDKKIEKLSKTLGPVDTYSSSWGKDDPRFFLVARKKHLEDLSNTYDEISVALRADPKKEGSWPDLASATGEEVSFYAIDELAELEKAEAEHAKKAAKAKKG